MINFDYQSSFSLNIRFYKYGDGGTENLTWTILNGRIYKICIPLLSLYHDDIFNDKLWLPMILFFQFLNIRTNYRNGTEICTILQNLHCAFRSLWYSDILVFLSLDGARYTCTRYSCPIGSSGGRGKGSKPINWPFHVLKLSRIFKHPVQTSSSHLCRNFRLPCQNIELKYRQNYQCHK